jgi:uncharacterized LabA/DUF88 family protein
MNRSTSGFGPVSLSAVAGLALSLAGCAVHPLPQDVVPVTYGSTVRIVSRIRCEAREGLELAVTKAIADNPSRRKQLEKIVNSTTIGFEFKFTMAETSSIGADRLEFERESAKSGENFKLALVGGLDSGIKTDRDMRRNERLFRIVDDLKEIAQARCRPPASPNPLYPISGRTGMADVVRTYIDLELLTDLGSGEKGAKQVTFTDDISFTTTFDAGASVDLEVKSAIGTLRLTKVEAGALARRRDAHTVKVVLARDKGDVDLPHYVEAIRDKDLQTFLAQMRSHSRNKVLIEFTRQRRAVEDREVVERVLGQPLP